MGILTLEARVKLARFLLQDDQGTEDSRKAI
jgi:hypothetical protein